MRNFRFWNRITGLTLGKLCQQRWLLAGLALLCFLLPMAIAPAAEAALSRGVSFSGIELAVTGPEGDPVPEQLEQLLPTMSDVSEYCRVTAMDYGEAIRSLQRGEVTAVLVLPENFVQGIMDGTNPDVELVVSGDSPMEALLTLWIGQSASDMLAAFQSGIYAVLELYTQNPPEGLHYQDVVAKINLRYVSWMMNRQDMFRVREVAATEQLPVGLHYGLSLLVFLMLAMAPFFAPVYDGKWLAAQRRFRTVGRGSGMFYLSTLAGCWLVIFPLLTAAVLVIVGGSPVAAIAAGALGGLFCAAFAGLCCLLTADTGGCGVLSFGCALVFLALSGGILPPVLMPRALQNWIDWSPVSWLRNLLAAPAGEYEVWPGMVAALAVSCAVMTVAGGLLYRRRVARGEAGL